ncbi:uncharacterized protein LOC124357185 [Homalodisca vitripennis]|uniref:uncharacterized protein LOC124357185 n=1 Tax=Homalodisca vitripennis TaxID=197043 RepID=UPI001EECADB0|nr:uncharacterized protein LOC124357185 [Homalodisca vitripennis]XP_046664663.1 uncharacterized protein LOC124357185 [Homalodisca vitripennis]
MVGKFYHVFLITGCLVTGLKDVRVVVPKAARKGDSVVLRCNYDLEGDPLYAVKWYKGRAEFYRYSPKENPPMKVFPIPGLSELHVDKSRSNETQLFLTSVTTSLTGQYNCEVSADAPSFHTAIVAANMDVVEVPSFPPTLTGIKSRYRLKDVMRANCTAAPSKPAVNLTWGLNGENVNPKLVKQYRQVPEKHPDLQQSMSILEVPLRTHHFRAGGRLKVRCTASLYDLYWQTTEKSVEQEGRSSEPSDNEISTYNDAKWDDDDYDEDYDTTSNVVVGAFPTHTSNESSSSSNPFLSSLTVVSSAALLSSLPFRFAAL